MKLFEALEECQFQTRNGDRHLLVKVTYHDGIIEFFASKECNAKRGNFISSDYAGDFEVLPC